MSNGNGNGQSNGNGERPPETRNAKGQFVSGTAGQWKPGKSGFTGEKNYGSRGRPEKHLLTSILRRILEEDDGAKAEKFVRAMLDAVLKGKRINVLMAREILDRIDGPLPTKIAGADGSDFVLRFENRPECLPPPGGRMAEQVQEN